MYDRPDDRRADLSSYLNRGKHVTAKDRAESSPYGRQNSVQPLVCGRLLECGRVLVYHWGRGVREGEWRGVVWREGKRKRKKRERAGGRRERREDE